MKTLIKKFRRSQAGTAMVEFAIVAPFLIFLCLGLIEVGRYMYFCVLAAHAAEAGAQYGSQSLTTLADTTGMKAAANADATGVTWTVHAQKYCTSGGAQALCSLPSSASSVASSGDTYYVKVKVDGTFTSLMSYPGIPNSITVSQTSVMRVLNQ